MLKNKVPKLILSATASICIVGAVSLASGNNIKNYSTQTLAGQDRYETSSKISLEYSKTYTSGIILASGKNFPDALSGSVLSQKYKMPLLLTGDSVKTSAQELSYIEKNIDKDKAIYILGGTGSIKKEVQDKLSSMGYSNIKRISGTDRYHTNAKVIDEFNANTGTPIIVASGENFPDALSISPIAAVKGYPILLITKNSIPDVIKEKIKELKPSLIYAIGGSGSISEKTLNSMADIANLNTGKIVRLSGVDRYETSLSIARYFDMDSDTATFANGLSFGDALSGATLSAQKNSPLILVNVSNAYNQKKYIDSQNTYVKEVFYGGEGVLPTVIKDYLSKAYDPSKPQEKAPGVEKTNPIPTVISQQPSAPEVIYAPAKNWTPTLPKVSSNAAKPATIQLSASDITRLQSYPQYLTAGGKKSDASKSFANMYATEKSNCEGVIKKFSPINFGDYKNAKVTWLTDPRLVYTSVVSQYCNRGVLQLTFSGNNKFGLKANQMYEADVEYRTVYSVVNGKASMQLQSIYYLSNFVPVNK